MKIVIGCICIIVAIIMCVLLISSAKESKEQTKKIWTFLIIWITDSSEVLSILFLSIFFAIILLK